MEEVKKGGGKQEQFLLLDLFKFISAVTIVAIHTQPFKNHMDSLFYEPYMFLKCFSIPFFFVSSSYLFFKKIDIENVRSMHNRNYVKKWIFRLLKVYMFYSFINLILLVHREVDLIFLSRFFLFGNNNGYLWFFAALMLALMTIYGLGHILTKKYCASVVWKNIIIIGLMISTFLMIILQFYYGYFRESFCGDFIRTYYLYFKNVRNFVSGFFYVLIGLLTILLEKYYCSKFNKCLCFIFLILAYVELIVVNNSNLWKEEYSTLIIAIFLIFLILECVNSNILVPSTYFMRKASRVFYFQQRYVIIVLSLLHKYFQVRIFDSTVWLFSATICVLTIATAVYIRLEKTKLQKILKYMY